MYIFFTDQDPQVYVCMYVCMQVRGDDQLWVGQEGAGRVSWIGSRSAEDSAVFHRLAPQGNPSAHMAIT